MIFLTRLKTVSKERPLGPMVNSSIGSALRTKRFWVQIPLGHKFSFLRMRMCARSIKIIAGCTELIMHLWLINRSWYCWNIPKAHQDCMLAVNATDRQDYFFKDRVSSRVLGLLLGLCRSPWEGNGSMDRL